MPQEVTLCCSEALLNRVVHQAKALKSVGLVHGLIMDAIHEDRKLPPGKPHSSLAHVSAFYLGFICIEKNHSQLPIILVVLRKAPCMEEPMMAHHVVQQS